MENKFGQFNNRKISDKICEIHKVNLWLITHPISGTTDYKTSEMCPECTREAIQQKENELIEQSRNSTIYLKTYNVLMNDSTLSDEQKEETCFGSFIVKTAEEQRFLEFAKGQVVKYLNGMVGNTLITGGTGVGKTHLIVSFAKELNEAYKAKGEPKSVLFVNLTEILREIRESFKFSSKEGYYSRKLREVDYLILDDLGVKLGNQSNFSKSAWEEEFIFDVLSHRSNTIITTNLSNEEITQLYSERVASRIRSGLEGNFFKVFGIKDKRYSINQLKSHV
ncbi:TPA: ATP-binding protein [Streptococcus suis]|nr:ATP-binding protein [Streptococcus suis]HEM2671313.1 ATP-binding protein [Streptococcus suis]HEM5233648.1 ATP-binding protein [Streptococcus suis]